MALIILAVLLDLYHGGVFLTILLSYGLFIKFLFSDLVTGKLRKTLSVMIWILFILLSASTFYVNHYLPHGPSYPTGEFVCQNDDQGPCGEQYKEDMSNLDIPGWAKFLRQSGGSLLILGLAFAGIIVSSKINNDN